MNINKVIKLVSAFFISVLLINSAQAESSFFEEGKVKYNEKKYEESKFLFQRSIVFNPKDQDSYLYLAKIYKFEDNKREEEKNINTVLLLDPKNEEANYLLMEIELKKSNYSKVKELAENFTKICNNLCDKKPLILESLKNLEPKNES
jgi:tetratricopeptide (TPR) repeat protein